MGIARSNRRHSAQPKPSRRGESPAQHLNNSNSLNFTIDSDFEQGRKVQTQIIELIERSGFNEGGVFAIKLALEEAMINAIKHGNRLAPGKKVHVQAKVDAERAEIIIEDQGPGFDRSSVPDPTSEENICKCSGRGILLMEAYMSSVKWTNKGRRVTMVKENEK